MKKIKLFQPYITQDARDNVQRVLSGTQLAEGPEVKAFEEEFAAEFGFEPWQIVSLNSGTASLELAYEIAGVNEYSSVIAPVLTCTATNIPLIRRKAQVVFADVEGRRHLNIDPEDLREKLEELEGWKKLMVVFVHFGGSSADLDRIEEICEEQGVELICDAAQALGSKLSRKARFSCVSLQAIKSLTAGDGGVLICRDEADAVLARKMRWFGYDRELKQKMGDCDLEIAGYKMHMNDITAAIGRGNLAHWKEIQAHREILNRVYNNRGQGKGFVPGIWAPQVIGMDYQHAKRTLEDIGVEIGQYHFPNSKYSVFRSVYSRCPNMDSIVDSYFMLPCHMGVSVQDADLIANTLWPK